MTGRLGTRIGIPRALGYYDFYPMWHGFFAELGAELVVSAPSSKEIVNEGIKAAVDGTCLPVKAFYGHVISLCSAKLDFIFMPRLVSVAEREFICPKFMGIPDTLSNIEGLPKVISPVININRGPLAFARAVMDTGRVLGASPIAILRAYNKGTRMLSVYRKYLLEGTPSEQAIQLTVSGGGTLNRARHSAEITVGLLGHSYLIHDPYVSMGIHRKLTSVGIRVITPDMLPEEVILRKANEWPKKMFWTSGRKMLGSVLKFLEDKLDGIIYVAAFGCGTDSFTGELVQRYANRLKTPCLLLNIDEHTGEAGLVTRLEAFTDMLVWGSKR